MQIEKILNNNVVQALDNNVEYIVMGKGLGFQKKVGDFVDKEKIEKTFVLENTEAFLNSAPLITFLSMMLPNLPFSLEYNTFSNCSIIF